jgi:hypothetical protein
MFSLHTPRCSFLAQTNLPDEDHVVRFVPWTRVRKDADDNVQGILGAAFQRREDEDGLSVNWLERAHSDPEARLRTTIGLLAANRTIGKKARIAVLNVGRFKAVCFDHKAKIRIVHSPEPGNEPHSEVRQLPREDLELLEALANDAVSEHHCCNDLS